MRTIAALMLVVIVGIFIAFVMVACVIDEREKKNHDREYWDDDWMEDGYDDPDL